MKNENIPADIKSKSLKDARKEIDTILLKLESQEVELSDSINDYQRLILLNNILIVCLKKNLRRFRQLIE